MGAATTIQPERILKDLQQLWAQMAVDQADSGGVLRACAMTLVVVAEDEQPAAELRLRGADHVPERVGIGGRVAVRQGGLQSQHG